jgi:hypothetical protein
MIAAIEKPLATRTLIAVTSEASRNAFIVGIDSSVVLLVADRHEISQMPQLHVDTFSRLV